MSGYLDGLRCPECGDHVFYSTLSETQVLCADMGHWIGTEAECKKVPIKRVDKLQKERDILFKQLEIALEALQLCAIPFPYPHDKPQSDVASDALAEIEKVRNV